MNTWQSLILGDSLELLVDNRGKNPPYTESGVPCVSGMVVTDQGLDFSKARFVDEETWKQWMPEPLRKNDVVMTSEAPLGRPALIRCDEPIALTQRVFGLRGKEGVLDSRFLYYSLFTNQVRAELLGRATGTTVVGIRQPALKAVKIPAPSYVEQIAIAEVLGSLDDKIAANTKLAATADHWVRAEYDLINRHVSEERAVGDFVTHRRKVVAPASLETPVPYVGLEHIPRRLMWLDSHGSSEDVTSTKSCFHAGDILFGKLRPYFHKVVTAPTSGICSTDVLVLAAKEESLSGYVLASLTHDDVIQTVTALSAGTRMPRTNWKDLAQVTIPWPGAITATAFSERVQIIREYIVGLMAENETLAETRDALLPQLMSGKLKTRDAEKVVENAL